MKEEARKAIEQLREAAADLGPEALDATLAAIHLQAWSYTILVGLFALMYIVLNGYTSYIYFKEPEEWDDGAVVIIPLILSTLVLAFTLLVYFVNSAWMGIVSPEAALALEVVERF